jgi:Uma2 family endonuclease
MATATTNRRVTEEEYFRMAETGEIAPGQRTQLIEGEIIYMFPGGPFHNDVIDDLVAFFTALSNGRWKVMNQRILRIDEYSLPEPDIMLAHPERGIKRYRGKHASPGEVFLVVEVSDSTLRLDKKDKIPLYAKAGVREVWIINLQERVLEIYRDPLFDKFDSVRKIKPGEFASPEAFADVKVNVAELLETASP